MFRILQHKNLRTYLFSKEPNLGTGLEEGALEDMPRCVVHCNRQPGEDLSSGILLHWSLRTTSLDD